MIDICKHSTNGVATNKLDASSPNTPVTLLTYSRACFETILRLYYLRHGFEYSDTYITHHLAVLAFMTLDQLKLSNPLSTDTASQAPGLDDGRSTLILTVKGLNDQGRNYYTPFALYHVVRSQMNSADVDSLYKWMSVHHDDNTASQLRMNHVQAQYPINIANMTEHPEKQRLGDLIQKYADLALEAHSPSTVTEHDSEN